MAAGLLRIGIVLAIATAVVAGDIGAATAQERTRTLFDMLFKKKSTAKKPAQTRKKKRKTTRVKRTVNRAKRRSLTASGGDGSSPAPAPQAVQKIENARVVLVVGDFLGGALADGLSDAFTELAGVRVVSRTRGSSGMVRDDFYDWPGTIGAIIAEEKPSVVVMMIGSNDRQKMTVDGRREQPSSPAWAAEYDRRLATFAKTVTDTGTPLLWVGMPPFRPNKMNAAMIGFNAQYRTAAQNVGAQFIDVWDGFADSDGKFTMRGPDINGRDTQLRSGDGINVTKAGRRKLAFYAERGLSKLLGNALDPSIGTLTKDNLPALMLTPVATPDTGGRTTPVALADPAFDGASELLGETVAVRSASELVRTSTDTFLLEGLAPDPQPGRVDDHSWPPRDLPKPEAPGSFNRPIESADATR